METFPHILFYGSGEFPKFESVFGDLPKFDLIFGKTKIILEVIKCEK